MKNAHLLYINPIGAHSALLTHLGRVTHICVGNLTIIGSDNGLSPGRRQAIIRTNDGILLIRPLGTNLSEILNEILIFSFKKMRLKVSSAKRGPFCLGLNVLRACHNKMFAGGSGKAGQEFFHFSPYVYVHCLYGQHYAIWSHHIMSHKMFVKVCKNIQFQPALCMWVDRMLSDGW